MIPERLPAAAGRARFAISLILLLAPAAATAADSRAFVLGSDFSTGTLSWVDLDTRAVDCDVAGVHSDAAIRWYGGLVYVVNRFLRDNIQVVDPAQGYAIVREFSTGNGSNPQDIAFLSPTKAYVSRYGSADLLIVNPSDPQGLPQSAISLAAFADGDGIPEMARMIRIGRWLYVACQRLTSFTPSNPSMVVVVDTQADTVVDVNPALPGKQAITLTLRNPVTTFEYARTLGRLWIGCAGAFGALDGGIEAIDPGTFTALGPAISEEQLGGDVADVAWNTPSHCFALVGSGSSNQLVSWNPQTGAKTGTLHTAPGGFSLPDMEINDRGELYVCKNPSAGDPALLVFSASTNALLATLGACLPPVALTFDHATDEVLSVPAPRPSSLRLLGPWPNPARGATRIALAGGGEARAEAAILDLAGRRVRSLPRSGDAERWWTWDLRDDQGRMVPAGVYLVQARTGSETVVGRIAVIR